MQHVYTEKKKKYFRFSLFLTNSISLKMTIVIIIGSVMWVMLTVQILPSDLEKRTKWWLSGEGRTEAILELEESNTRSNIPPCMWVEYCERWDRSKLWIKGAMLATFSGNIWSRLKSPTIKILCCIGSSFINKINLSIKKPTGPGARYTITKKSPFIYF